MIQISVFLMCALSKDKTLNEHLEVKRTNDRKSKRYISKVHYLQWKTLTDLFSVMKKQYSFNGVANFWNSFVLFHLFLSTLILSSIF